MAHRWSWAARTSALTTQTNASGYQDVYAQGVDITSELNSGQLAGLIQVRDQTLPGLISNLDTLASGMANALNTANEQGFDLNGNAGTALFTPPSVSGQGYAATMAVQITNPSLIAANSDGTADSNGNVAVLSAIQNANVARGRTSPPITTQASSPTWATRSRTGPPN